MKKTNFSIGILNILIGIFTAFSCIWYTTNVAGLNDLFNSSIQEYLSLGAVDITISILLALLSIVALILGIRSIAISTSNEDYSINKKKRILFDVLNIILVVVLLAGFIYSLIKLVNVEHVTVFEFVLFMGLFIELFIGTILTMSKFTWDLLSQGKYKIKKNKKGKVKEHNHLNNKNIEQNKVQSQNITDGKELVKPDFRFGNKKRR